MWAKSTTTPTALTALALTYALCFGTTASAHRPAGLRAHKPAALRERKLELERREIERSLIPRDNTTVTNSTADYVFYTNKTEPFLVTSLPEVDFDFGELYSGLVPIDYSNTSEQLFFFFKPKDGDPVDEVTIWLNGGPGCSSLEAFFQENGPILWQPGTYKPVANPYAWSNLTNMLWVDQPIGTGFSTGTPYATSEADITAPFLKFFKNWEDLFGIKNFKIYVTGESYAGRYVPYISAAMLDQNNTEYYNLSGALVYDPCIGEFDYVQEEIPTYPFVEANANLFGFNDTYMAYLKEMHESCGFSDYIDQYLTFPPSGVQPHLYFNYTSNATCDIFDTVYLEAFNSNPCFNPYEITQNCPILWDVLGFPGALEWEPEGAVVYFDREDVKTAIHAPPNVTWSECSTEPVFIGDGGPQSEGDTSLDPIQHVLPQVIEATNRVLIGNGDYDFIILTNGTLLSIQNMTWHGSLGFQSQPNATLVVDTPDLVYQDAFAENGLTGYDGPQGVVGLHHYERGLMWVETFESGHMQPQYQGRASLKHLEWLLGHTEF